MAEPLALARDLAAAVRYRGETAALGAARMAGAALADVRGSLDGLDATPELTPDLAAATARAAKRLLAPEQCVRAVVYPSAEMAASCVTLDDATAYVRFSSGMVEAFDQAELAFVAGHELGHHLLDHGVVSLEGEGELAGKAVSRAREMSCDRLGLLACGGAEAAMRAIMKTVSGLTERRLRFDAGAYLRSALGEDAEGDRRNLYATHPPMAVRARALLAFDAVNRQFYPRFDDKAARAALARADDRVEKDMLRFVEGHALSEVERLANDARDWIWLGAAAADGRMEARERDRLADVLGEDFVARATRTIATMSVTEAHRFIAEKAWDAAQRLKAADAAAAERRLAAELVASELAFRQDSASNFVRAAIRLHD